MAKETAKMKSWQVFHFARKHLGRSTLYSLFGKKNARSIDFWCEDPLYTGKDDNAYDPLKGVKNLVDLLDDNGHCDTVRATLAYIAAGTSCDTGIDPAVVDPLPSIGDEILADFRAVATLQRSIEAGDDIELVVDLMRDAIAEIERTVARYRKDLP